MSPMDDIVSGNGSTAARQQELRRLDSITEGEISARGLRIDTDVVVTPRTVYGGLESTLADTTSDACGPPWKRNLLMAGRRRNSRVLRRSILTIIYDCAH